MKNRACYGEENPPNDTADGTRPPQKTGGQGAAQQAAGARKFRIAVTPVFVFIAMFGLLGLFSLVWILDGPNFNTRALAVASAVLALTSLGLAWMTAILDPTALSIDGIVGYSFWGRRRFVAWKDITAARTFRLLNLRWLRIYSIRESQVTWVALFLARKAEFREEVRRLAPPDSPISNHLA